MDGPQKRLGLSRRTTSERGPKFHPVASTGELPYRPPTPYARRCDGAAATKGGSRSPIRPR
jgi:hypothetical protein